VVVTTAFASDTTLTTQIRQSFERLNSNFKFPLWRVPFYHKLTFIPGVKQAMDEMKLLEGIARRILDERRTRTSPRESSKTKYLIDLLNSGQDEESNTKLTDEEIIHNAFTFFLAGTNTTSTLMSWLCNHLLTYPDVYEKVQKEIDEVIPDDVTQITVKDVSRLNYFTQVLNETLRLTPPLAKAPERYFAHDFELGDWKCEKGSAFPLDIYLTHHSPDLYPNPDKFDPDRWQPKPTSDKVQDLDDMNPEEREKKRLEPFKFIPFGVGRRTCIGKYFALLESKVVMSVILKLYKLKKPPNVTYPRELFVGVTVVEPVGGVPLLWEKRQL